MRGGCVILSKTICIFNMALFLPKAGKSQPSKISPKGHGVTLRDHSKIAPCLSLPVLRRKAHFLRWLKYPCRQGWDIFQKKSIFDHGKNSAFPAILGQAPPRLPISPGQDLDQGKQAYQNKLNCWALAA
jgi:hypothetical protein